MYRESIVLKEKAYFWHIASMPIPTARFHFTIHIIVYSHCNPWKRHWGKLSHVKAFENSSVYWAWAQRGSSHISLSTPSIICSKWRDRHDGKWTGTKMVKDDEIILVREEQNSTRLVKWKAFHLYTPVQGVYAPYTSKLGTFITKEMYSQPSSLTSKENALICMPLRWCKGSRCGNVYSWGDWDAL